MLLDILNVLPGYKKSHLDYPLLMDVSGWQTYPNTGFGTDFKKARENGIVGAMIRAGSCRQSDGVLYEDYDLQPNVQLSNEMVEEFPRWFYWYMRAQWGGVRQAEYFLKLLDDAGAGDAWVGLVGDFESSGSSGLSKKDAASEWDKFMEVLRYHYPSKRHMIYSRALFINQFALYMPWANFYDLWIPIYPYSTKSYSHPWQNLKYKPKLWDDWTFWQWTDKGQGSLYGTQSKQVDLNYFNGTLEEFYMYADMDVEVPEPPEPPMSDLSMMVMTSLRIRTGPGTNYSIVGMRGAGETLYVQDIEVENQQNVWVKDALGWSAATYMGRQYLK